jgi:hypothetical protein
MHREPPGHLSLRARDNTPPAEFAIRESARGLPCGSVLAILGRADD